MIPIKFKQMNIIFAEKQKEYLPLPACRESQGTITSCWKLSIIKRLIILFTGKLFLSTFTFNKPLQPQILNTKFKYFER